MAVSRTDRGRSGDLTAVELDESIQDVAEQSSHASSIEYAAENSLLYDLQGLLADDLEIADAVAVVGPNAVELALHTQLLVARSSHFATSLRPPWRRNEIHFPEQDPDAFRDVLEFLYTGSVRLESDSGSAVRVAALAHYLNISELEQLALSHISRCLSPSNFPAHIRATLDIAAGNVPDVIVDMLSNYAAEYPMRILTCSALFDVSDNKQIDRSVAHVANVYYIWALIARHVALDFGIPPRDRSPVVDGLVAWARRYASFQDRWFVLPPKDKAVPEFLSNQPPLHETNPAACAVFLAKVLEGTSHVEERNALVSVLTSVTPSFFARRVEPLGILQLEEVLTKYRYDAVQSNVYESIHPHPRGGTFSTRVRVLLPDGAIGCNVRFDPRTSFGCGTELVFYRHDPVMQPSPCFTVTGVAVESALITCGRSLWLHQFWFALISPSIALDDGEMVVGLESQWGYKFVVRPYFSVRDEKRWSMDDSCRAHNVTLR